MTTETNAFITEAGDLSDLAEAIAALTHGDIEALGGLASQMVEAEGEALRENLRLLADTLEKGA